jgi:hypothetical protein
MKIEPLPKHILDRAIELGVISIDLSFEGGSDEGFLHVELASPPERRSDFSSDIPYIDLEEAVESWAWDVYCYSGAGEGSPYGDDIEYDIAGGTARHSAWYMARHDEESIEIPLEVCDDGTGEALPS